MAKFGKNKPMMNSQRQAFFNNSKNTNPLDNIDLTSNWQNNPDDNSTYWGMNTPTTFRERHEACLYERVLGGLSTPQASMRDLYKVTNGKLRKQFLYWARQNRMSYGQCERITLSDNFVRNAVELAYSYPQYILQLFPKAIPCFDKLFVEWNEMVRWQTIQKKFEEMGIAIDGNEKSVANDVGFYIQKLDSIKFSDKAYSVTFSTCDAEERGDGKKSSLQLGIAQHLWAIDFDSDADVEHVPNYDNQENLRLFIGGAYEKVFKDDPNFQRLNILQKHCALHMNEWGEMMWNAGIKDKWDHRKYAINSANGYDGDLRFIIAVFSLLNYPRYVRELIRPRKINAPIIWGKKAPQYETKVIELELPKSGVNVYQQLFTGHGTPKRQHVRRGHWRIVKDIHGRIRKRSWVKQCTVGNSNLGIINHEYILKSKSK